MKTKTDLEKTETPMLNILEGEGTLVQRTKKGFYVNMPNGKNLYIPYSSTLTEAIFEDSETVDP